MIWASVVWDAMNARAPKMPNTRKAMPPQNAKNRPFIAARLASARFALTQTAGKIGVYTNSSAHGKGNHQVLDGERQRNGGKRRFVHTTDKDAVHNVIKCLNQHRNHHRY